MRTAPAAGKRDNFYRTLIALAFPIVLQNLMNSAVSAADTVMLGYVSQQALSASALAGNIQTIVNMFLFGIASGSSVLIAQYWGRGDMDTIERTIGIALRFTVAMGLFFSGAAVFFPEAVMRIYTADAELVALGAQYLRVVGVGYLLNAFTQVYISSQRAMERVLFGTVVNMISMFLNVVLNACFIFGLGPFPKMGIVGVAIATVTAQAVSFAIAVFDVAQPNRRVRVRIAYIFSGKKELFRDFVKYTLPALGNDFVWVLGFSMYSVILGHLDSNIVAANSYASVVRSLSTVLCSAIANVAAIIMGKTLGEDRLDDARVYGRRFMVMCVATGCAAALCIGAASPFIISHVHMTETAQGYLRFMLNVSMANVFGMSVNAMLIQGILRAGGDTRFGFYMDLFFMWVYGVGLGALCAFVFKIPPQWVYFVLFIDEVVKMPFALAHYGKKKWVKNITRDMAALG